MNPKNYNQNNNLRHQSGIEGKLNFENNSQFNGYQDPSLVYDQAPLSPNYTKAELNNADIPTKIGREIRAEKYRTFFIAFISFLMMVVGIFFIACFYGAKKVTNEHTHVTTQWLIPENSVPEPGFMIALLVIGLVIFTLAMIHYAQLLTNVRAYKADILNGKNSIPYFLIKTYKSLIARVVYANWIAISLYLIMGVIVGVLWGVREMPYDSVHMKFGTELIILYILLGITFVLHMVTLLTAKYRKGNLNSYFNTQIVSDETAHEISHHANKICLVSFIVLLAVIFFAIAIPWLIIRRKQKKPMLP